MAMDERDVIELLAKILIEGRGGGIINPADPQFGIGGSALTRSPGRKNSKARNVSSRATRVTLPGTKKKRKPSPKKLPFHSTKSFMKIYFVEPQAGRIRLNSSMGFLSKN